MFPLILILIALCPAIPFAQEWVTPTIQKQLGQIEIQPFGETGWKNFRVGDLLKKGDKVKLHGSAQLQVSFSDQIEIRIQDSAMFYMDEMIQDSNTLRLNWTLFEGSYHVRMQPLLYPQHIQNLKFTSKPFSLETSLCSFVLKLGKSPEKSETHVLLGTAVVSERKDKKSFILKDREYMEFYPQDSSFRVFPLNVPLLLLNNPGLDSTDIQWDEAKSLLNQKRKEDVLSGKSLARVLVTEFTPSFVKAGKWPVSKFLSDFIAAEFRKYTYRECIRGGSSEMPVNQLAGIYEADRIVTGKIHQFELTKKSIFDQKLQKYILVYQRGFNLELSIWEGQSEKKIRSQNYKAQLSTNKENTLHLDSLLLQPMSMENEIFRESLVGKILISLKKQLKKFASYAI